VHDPGGEPCRRIHFRKSLEALDEGVEINIRLRTILRF
jgi:hypothetical protein